jgi:hypothetical protein
MAIMVVAPIGVFFFGITLDLFGKPIDFGNIGFYLFFLSIFVGIYGIAFALLDGFAAFSVMVVLCGIYLIIFIAGKLARGEL